MRSLSSSKRPRAATRASAAAALALLALPACGGGSASADTDGRPRGLVLLEANGCLACHVYGEDGTQSLGAPELTRQGQRQRGVEWLVAYMRAPKDTNPKAMMPPYSALPEDDLRELAEFLETSD